MGLIYAMLTLTNPKRPDVQPVQAEAMADTGSVYLVIPEHIRSELQLEELEKREVTLADGSRRQLAYVGPVQLHFKNRGGYFGALVMGDEILLGAIPMEDMDLVLLPKQRLVDVNPANPNIACGVVK